MAWLFCYGSNHPDQLAERLGRRDFKMVAARLPDHWRIFRGYSRRWDGGVASIAKHKGSSVYGYLAEVTAGDLTTMDRFEGVASGNYRRETVKVETPVGVKSAVVYLSNSTAFTKPTKPYLEAVAKTISVFWRSGTGGPVTWNEIPIR